MAELNPPLGTTTPEIFLDNVKRADELVNGPAGTVNDRGGEPLDTARNDGENDQVRQNLIPLSKQYATLAAAQADIANIPEGSSIYVRSPDEAYLAIEYMNVGGTLVATGRKMLSALPTGYQAATAVSSNAANTIAITILVCWLTAVLFISFPRPEYRRGQCDRDRREGIPLLAQSRNKISQRSLVMSFC